MSSISYIKRISSELILFILPNLLWGDMSLGYGHIVEGCLAFPSYRVDVFNIKYGIGGRYPKEPGIVAGASLFDWTGFFIGDKVSAKGFFAPGVEVMLPLNIRIRTKNSYYPTVLYTSFDGLPWGLGSPRYLRVGGGVDFIGGLLGIEVSFLKTVDESRDLTQNSVCGGMRLSFGAWIPPENCQESRPIKIDTSLLSLSTGESRRYLRKSISFYNGFVVKTESPVPDKRYEYLWNSFIKSVINSPRIARFDRNPIPDSIMKKTIVDLNRKDVLHYTDIQHTIETILAPEIVKIVNMEKELRAKEFVSDQERSNFLTAKAKEFGITTEDLERIMNAAYIIIPYLDGYSRYKDKGNVERYYISGGMFIYNVVPDPKPSVQLFKAIASTGSTSDLSAWLKQSDDEAKFKDAVDCFTSLLDVEISKIFRIHGDIVSAYGNNVELELTKKHGISLDDKFDFVEFYENREGEIVPCKVGYGFVTKIGHPSAGAKSDYTKLQVITGKPAKGMIAVERPSWPIEIKLGLASYPFKVNSSNNPDIQFLKENSYCLGIMAPLILMCYDLRIRASDLTGIPQSFVSLNWLQIGIPNAEFEYRGSSFRGLYTEIIGLGFQKKVYYRRFSIGPEVKIKGIMYGFSYESATDTSNFATWGLGVVGNGFFEYVITPNINIGCGIGYGFGAFTPWVGPNVSLSKMGWQAYLVWNP